MVALHWGGLLSMACVLAVIVIIFNKSCFCMQKGGGEICISAFLEALKMLLCFLKANIKETKYCVMNVKVRRGRILPCCRQPATGDYFFKNEYHIQIRNIL